MTRHQDYLYKAINLARYSPDPYKQVGAVIVSSDEVEAYHGWNTLTEGLPDTEENWDKETKQHLVVHAEMNAMIDLLSAARIPARAVQYTPLTIYSTHRPCNDCVKLLVQVGVKAIYYIHDRNDDGRENYTDYMLASAGVLIHQVTEEEL